MVDVTTKKAPSCICGKEECTLLTNAYGAFDRIRSGFIQVPPTIADIQSNKKRIGLYIRKIYIEELGRKMSDFGSADTDLCFIAAHHFHPKLLKKATMLAVDGYKSVYHIPRNLSIDSAQRIQLNVKIKVPGSEDRYFILPDYEYALLDLRTTLKRKNKIVRNTVNKSIDRALKTREGSDLTLDSSGSLTRSFHSTDTRSQHTTFTTYSDLKPIEEADGDEDEYSDDEGKESSGTEAESDDDPTPEWRKKELEDWKRRLESGENKCICQSRKCFAISLLCEIIQDPRGFYTPLPKGKGKAKGEGPVFRQAFLEALRLPDRKREKGKKELIALHHFNPIILQRSKPVEDGLFVIPKTISKSSAVEYNLSLDKEVPGEEDRFFCLPTYDASHDLAGLFIV